MTSVHVVPHTHWDREWYRPFQGFRMRLVEAVDRVLELLDAEPGMRFTLDGQVAIVDDYLEIRPEQAKRIRDHVRSGRLAIGPWLILMDEFLAGGETIVRNLEAGWHRAEELGGPMRIGHLPDMFGHVAQMPQILRRAGIGDAVVWRGVPAAIDHHAFRWEAPDGSSVRAEYLIDGNGNAAGLLADPDRAEAAIARLAEAARPWFGTDPVLAMAGTDHSGPDAGIAAFASRDAAGPDGAGIRISTLAEYLAVSPDLGPGAPSWQGELRSGARANLLTGVASARIDVKRAAARAERWLSGVAEPLLAIHVAPDDWPEPYRLGFDNRSDDHRVRFAAPLPRRARSSFAEGQFAVVERGMTVEGGYREAPLPTFPAMGWVDAGGLAILLDHVTEYELADGGRELAITVIRSIGLLSRAANPARLDPAGPELPVPQAQLRGPWRLTFGLLPHRGDWQDGGVVDAAERYANGLVAADGADPRGAWPPAGSAGDAFTLAGPHVTLASLRRRPGGWLEARIVNLSNRPGSATLRAGIVEARGASLLGEAGASLEVDGGALRMELGAAELRTVQLRRHEPAMRLAAFADALAPRRNP